MHRAHYDSYCHDMNGEVGAQMEVRVQNVVQEEEASRGLASARSAALPDVADR